MIRFRSSLLFLTFVLGWLSTQSHAQQQQVSLNANPLDPFPANTAELLKIADKVPAIKEAINYFREGNADKLKDSLLAARTANAEFPKVDVMLARMFMANGQWQDASQVLENHVALNATDAEAYKNFAEIGMVSGRWTDAWLEVEKAMSLVDSMNFSVPRKQNFVSELTKLRAELAELRQDVPLATKLFEELAKQQPKDGSPLWSLGQIKVRNGDVDGGMQLLKKAKALTPALPQPELAVARSLVGKDKAKAEEWFKKGFAKEAGSTEANLLNYIQFLIDEDRIEEAKGYLEKAPEEYKKSREYRLLKALVHRYLGENADAEKLLSALYQENTEDPMIVDQLALVLVESADQGKLARADQLSEANVRKAPNAERTVATAAWVKFKTGNADIADKVLGQILKGGRLEPQTAYYAAKLLELRGMKAEYARFLHAASSGSGSFPQKRAAKKEFDAFQKANPGLFTPPAPAPAPTPAPAGKK
jgi:predicted Zn-dependent protease